MKMTTWPVFTDNNGYIDSTYAITVNLATGTGALGGTTTISALNGCAAFNNLTYSSIAPLTLA